MQNQSPISEFQDSFAELSHNFSFEEKTPTSARVESKNENIIFKYIDLDLTLFGPALVISSPLPCSRIADTKMLLRLLASNNDIESYLSIKKVDSENYSLMHNLELQTDQNLKVSPAKFHQYFSEYVQDFSVLAKETLKETEDFPQAQTEGNDSNSIPEEDEPVGFKPWR